MQSAAAAPFVFDVTPPQAELSVNADGRVPADRVAPGQLYVREAKRLDIHARAAGFVPYDAVVTAFPLAEPDGRVHIAVEMQPSSFSSWFSLHYFAAMSGLGVLAAGLVLGLGMRARGRRMQAHGRFVQRLQEDSDADAFAGRRIGRWRIVKKLGSGGMAAVYLAYPDDTLDAAEAVAIKLMHDEVVDDPEYRRRFEREIQACMKVSHRSIMRLIDWGNEEGRLLYLVAEYLEGEPLRYKIRAGGLRPDAAMDYLRPLMQGVMHAHEQGIVHRDLKPENVMVCEDGQVKVMDFGLARVPTADVTRSGVMGTPGYMAPEQIRAQAVDARADQYAIGIIAFELLSGSYPLEAADTVKLLYKHAAPQPLPSVRDFKPTVGHAIDRVIARMVAKTPDARYPTLREALEALEEACRSGR